MKCEVQLMHNREYHFHTEYHTFAFKAGEREPGAIYERIPSLVRSTEMVSSHLGEGLCQEKTTTTLYCEIVTTGTHCDSHGTARGQNIGSGQSRGREA